MKKIFVLFALSMCFMSFDNANKFTSQEKKLDAGGCCTATVTYNGEYVSKFTNCGENLTLACNTARARAQDFIKARKQ